MKSPMFAASLGRTAMSRYIDARENKTVELVKRKGLPAIKVTQDTPAGQITSIEAIDLDALIKRRDQMVKALKHLTELIEDVQAIDKPRSGRKLDDIAVTIG